MINSINRLPVVIVANYRTGSSELGQQLAKQHNVPWIPEPYHFPEHQARLTDYYHNNKNYVAKFIVDQLPHLSIHQQVLETSCFKIRLTRDNKLEQLVSYYIATQSNTWRQTKPTIPEYQVDINAQVMQDLATTLYNNDKLLSESDIEFDITCSYESLKLDQIKQTTLFKTTRPNNINQVIQLAKKIIG